MMAIMNQITLKGHLDRPDEDWLEGFLITLQPEGETILVGHVADQTALYGLLLRIRDLGIPLLSVNGTFPESSKSCG